MGFFFRKSLKLGPLRFNLSKSGLGTSVGVKGARIGVNARGKAYVAGGRYGLYYRKQIGPPNGSSTETANQGIRAAGSGIFAGIVIALAAMLGIAFIGGHRVTKPSPTEIVAQPESSPTPTPSPLQDHGKSHRKISRKDAKALRHHKR